VLSKASRLPLYHQVESDVRERIASGEWAPGEQIPTEKALCAFYGASRVTIRQAIGNLVAEGLLVREAGRGTFVRAMRITAGARGLTSFSDEIAGLGLRAGSKVLRSVIEPCPANAADRLRLHEGAPVVAITRLRLGDGSPVGIQTALLPADRFPGLEQVDLSERSLYQTLAEQYGVRPGEAEETFYVAPIRGDDARLLEVRSGSCGFRVERVTFDEESAFEFATSVLRGDRYSVRLGLRAEP
jgi:GntR family transcriptional regulator